MPLKHSFADFDKSNENVRSGWVGTVYRGSNRHYRQEQALTCVVSLSFVYRSLLILHAVATVVYVALLSGN